MGEDGGCRVGEVRAYIPLPLLNIIPVFSQFTCISWLLLYPHPLLSASLLFAFPGCYFILPPPFCSSFCFPLICISWLLLYPPSPLLFFFLFPSYLHFLAVTLPPFSTFLLLPSVISPSINIERRCLLFSYCPFFLLLFLLSSSYFPAVPCFPRLHS